MIDKDELPLGFIGLGTMGEPMALNLLRAGGALIVWNRSKEKMKALEQAGAQTAANPADLFDRTRIVFLMLSSESAIDAVLGRGTAGFVPMVADHIIVNMGTPSPTYSDALGRDLQAANARYVEAPVSGQKGPAEAGQLVAMLAGDLEDLQTIRPLLNAMCRDVILCGAVPKAVATKLASNVFVATMIAALAEAVNYGRHFDVDPAIFSELMTTGPMASDLLRMKLPKLLNRDFSVQASLDTVVESARLISSSADEKGIAVPLLALSASLYGQARSLGDNGDVTAIIRALEHKSNEKANPEK